MEYSRRLLTTELERQKIILDGRQHRQRLYTLHSGEVDPLTTELVANAKARIADLTQALAVLDPLPPEPTDYINYFFKRGDYIEVTAKREADDFGTVRGTALDDRQHFGYAVFGVMIDANTILTYNLNTVNVKLLHSADIARGVDVLAGN